MKKKEKKKITLMRSSGRYIKMNLSFFCDPISNKIHQRAFQLQGFVYLIHIKLGPKILMVLNGPKY